MACSNSILKQVAAGNYGEEVASIPGISLFYRVCRVSSIVSKPGRSENWNFGPAFVNSIVSMKHNSSRSGSSVVPMQ